MGGCVAELPFLNAYRLLFRTVAPVNQLLDSVSVTICHSELVNTHRSLYEQICVTDPFSL